MLANRWYPNGAWLPRVFTRCLDVVYTECADGSLRFQRVVAPTGEELSQRVHRLARRIGRHLERQGLLQRGVESDYLTEDAFEVDALKPLHSASIIYLIALGPEQGHRSSLCEPCRPARMPYRALRPSQRVSALQAGVSARAYERVRVQRLGRCER